jgi:hypothetical protein
LLGEGESKRPSEKEIQPTVEGTARLRAKKGASGRFGRLSPTRVTQPAKAATIGLIMLKKVQDGGGGESLAKDAPLIQLAFKMLGY